MRITIQSAGQIIMAGTFTFVSWDPPASLNYKCIPRIVSSEYYYSADSALRTLWFRYLLIVIRIQLHLLRYREISTPILHKIPSIWYYYVIQSYIAKISQILKGWIGIAIELFSYYCRHDIAFKTIKSLLPILNVHILSHITLCIRTARLINYDFDIQSKFTKNYHTLWFSYNNPSRCSKCMTIDDSYICVMHPYTRGH